MHCSYFSDDFLVKLRQRDDHARKQLYDDMSQSVYPFLVRRCTVASDADDIYARVLEKVVTHSKRKTFAGAAELRARIYRIAHTTLIDWYKKDIAWLDTHISDATHTHRDPEPDHIAQINTLHDAIQKAIESLPPLTAEMIRLRLIDGLSFDDIGSLMNKSGDTVKQTIYNGIKKIKQRTQYLLLLCIMIIL
ncbi:MAG: RNA polymerase sigma factor [Candidatus Absconditabacterales bacterium]|nr:RNA polymerase sigma factor [Candidatus Absconditabacterales bacterium]